MTFHEATKLMSEINHDPQGWQVIELRLHEGVGYVVTAQRISDHRMITVSQIDHWNTIKGKMGMAG